MDRETLILVVMAGVPIVAFVLLGFSASNPSAKTKRAVAVTLMAVIVLGGIGLAARYAGSDAKPRTAVETARDREADLEDRIRVLEGSVSHLRSELDDLRSKIRSVESDVSGLQR